MFLYYSSTHPLTTEPEPEPQNSTTVYYNLMRQLQSEYTNMDLSTATRSELLSQSRPLR